MASVGGLGPRAPSASDRIVERGEIPPRQAAYRAEAGQRATLGDIRAAERSSADRVRASRADDDRAASLRVDARRAERVTRREEAEPAVATAAEDLRSRMKDEAVRDADAMTQAATQRALRDYLRAG